MKNTRAKTVTRDKAYEIWTTSVHAGWANPDEVLDMVKRDRDAWTWYVLKSWQGDDDKPYARWFCDVVTPMCPDGELGDVYVSEIKANARKIK